MSSGQKLRLFPYKPAPPQEITTLVDTDGTVVSSLTVPASTIRPSLPLHDTLAHNNNNNKDEAAGNMILAANDANASFDVRDGTHSVAPSPDGAVSASLEPTYKQQVGDSGIVQPQQNRQDLPSTTIPAATAVAIFDTSTSHHSQSLSSLPTSCSSSTRCIVLALLVAILAATGGAIGAWCGLGRCISDNDNTSDEAARKEKIVAFINSITFSASPLSYPSSNNEDATAEVAALTWLIDQEPARRFQEDDYRDQRRLRQRYALAALYFSGGAWANDNVWLSDSDECYWLGITCSEDGSVTEVKLTNGATGGGSIPADLALLSSLRVLHLFENQHTGTIPTSLGSLSFLENLEVYINRLTGTIPTELGQLKTLFSLSLFANELKSTVPTELGNLSNLIYLALSDNSYSGTVPTQLQELTNLQFLFLHNNDQLDGSLDFMCARNLTTLVADCDLVTCSCCTFCCVEGGFGGIPEYGEQQGWCKQG
jgi:hypothetical protein